VEPVVNGHPAVEVCLLSVDAALYGPVRFVEREVQHGRGTAVGARGGELRPFGHYRAEPHGVVHVRVDAAGNDQAPGCIDGPGRLRAELAAPGDGGDLLAFHRDVLLAAVFGSHQRAVQDQEIEGHACTVLP
jgi:hypothetical protein